MDVFTIKNIFTIKSIFPVERFYYQVYSSNVGVAIIPNQTLIRRKIKCFYINLCKYYLVVAVLVEGKVHCTVCYIMFGWLVKIKSMQEDNDGRLWVASLIIWCSPWKEVVDSRCEPSILSTFSWHQLEELALKSPVLISSFRLALGNQRFPVRVRLLAMCRGELSAVIARLMSKCLWSGWKW